MFSFTKPNHLNYRRAGEGLYPVPFWMIIQPCKDTQFTEPVEVFSQLISSSLYIFWTQ